MMRIALMTVVLGLHASVIMAASGRHHFGSAMLMDHLTGILITHGPTIPTDLRGLAFHGDGRERLNRKAQREQHDEEKFAPVRHGYGV